MICASVLSPDIPRGPAALLRWINRAKHPIPSSYSRRIEGRRIDEVRIELPAGTVSIPWSSRDALMEQLEARDVIADVPEVREAFLAVGTSRPVSLTDPQKLALRKVITFWANEVGGGYEDLPEGIHELRNALHVDLPVDDDELLGT